MSSPPSSWPEEIERPEDAQHRQTTQKRIQQKQQEEMETTPSQDGGDTEDTQVQEKEKATIGGGRKKTM